MLDMKSSKKLLIVIVLLAVGGVAITAGVIARSRQQAVVEAAARQALEKLGALVTMDRNQQHVQGIALLPNTQQDDLEQVMHLAAELPHLELLRLVGTGVTDEQLAQIAGNTSLTMLGLSKTGISDAGLGHLQNLNNLQALYLVGTRVTAQGLKSIGKLSSLEILDLSETSLEGDLASLLPLDQLSHLLLAGVPLNDAAVDNLLRLKSLSRLTIPGSVLGDESNSKLDQKGIKIDRASEQEIEHADIASSEPTEDISGLVEESSPAGAQ